MPRGKTKAEPESRSPLDRKLAERGYQKRERTEITGWEKGRTAEGTIVRIREGKFGPLLTLRDSEGVTRTYGCPTVLTSMVEDLVKGTMIAIVCKGTIATEKGHAAWDFDVYTKPTGKSDEENGDIPF